MVEQKTLLNPADIRTMAKDQKQLKKSGFTKPFANPSTPKNEQKETTRLDTILKESIQERQNIEKNLQSKAMSLQKKPDAQQGNSPVVDQKSNEQRRKFMEDIEQWANSN